MIEHLYVQLKYLSFVSSRFERFKQLNTNLFNCRCPFCGDSVRKKSKARGYFYKHKDDGLLAYQCHNCGINKKFKNILKLIDLSNYKSYILECLKNKGSIDSTSNIVVKEIKNKVWRDYLTPISNLSKIHPARIYLKERMIPKEKYHLFFYTANFKDFTDKLKLNYIVPSDARVVLIETDKFDNIQIIIARAIFKSELRYVTLKLNENYPKIFGYNSLDFSKPIKIVEGAIDSLFIDNCIATLDSNLISYKKVEELKNTHPVLIWDNEPRNKQIVRFISKAIDACENVVIYPENLEHKDINLMFKNHININELLNNNTFNGIVARLKFSKWNRVSNAFKQFNKIQNNSQ